MLQCLQSLTKVPDILFVRVSGTRFSLSHRYVLPPNVNFDDFNAREAVFKQHLIEQQMAKGNCWPQVLIQEYDSGRNRTSFQYKWSHHGNVIAVTEEKLHHSSYGSSTSFTHTSLVDMDENGVKEQTVYGTQFVGGVRVVPKPSQFTDWDWNEVSCYTNDSGEPIIIRRKNKYVRDDTDDPWHTLRSPKRMMQGYANLDGSPTLLIYDMNTAYGRKGVDVFNIEVWNVTNGESVYEIKLDGVGDNVVGFYKNCAIMSLSSTDETVFVNLTSGLVEKSFPHQSAKNSFHLFDGKIAFMKNSAVSVHDFNSGELIKRIDIGIFKTDQSFKFTGVSFDKWKLVVSTKLAQAYVSYDSSSGGFVAVFDMTKDFTLLCTKFFAQFCREEVKIACLPNGSIAVGETALIVLDFIHQYLEKPISVAIFKSGLTSVQVAKINPLDLSCFAQKTLKRELGQLSAMTYYEVSAAEAPRARNDRYAWHEDYSYLDYKSMRITFISAQERPVSRFGRYDESTVKTSFLQYWRKHTDTVAPFALTSSNCNEQVFQINNRRSDAFVEEGIMIFEKYNPTKQRWEITEPVVPQGINLEIEYDV